MSLRSGLGDKYTNFWHLRRIEHEGRDFIVTTRFRDGATTAIVAPHGGNIEPGTSELAAAIAGEDLNLAIFEGTKAHKNVDLHITSTRFDEPRCVAIVEQSNAVLTLHGEQGADTMVFIGGADKALGDAISGALADAGLSVATHNDVKLQGTSPQNICNRGKQGKGVQLELTRGLRATFFDSLTTEGRKATTSAFKRFVIAVRRGLDQGCAL